MIILILITCLFECCNENSDIDLGSISTAFSSLRSIPSSGKERGLHSWTAAGFVDLEPREQSRLE